MKVFQYDNFPDILIKFSSKRKYLEDFCAGIIYMNESGYFRKLEDSYRGDKYDGKCPVNLKKHGASFIELSSYDNPQEYIRIPAECIETMVSGFQNDDKIPLFCCSQVTEEILRQESEKILKFKEEFILEMEQFGAFCVIFNKNEFINNMSNYLIENHLVGREGLVSYVDIHSEYPPGVIVNRDIDQSTAFFKKDLSYRWQNEWRILIGGEDRLLIGQDSNHYVANIKPLTWFDIRSVDDLRHAEFIVRE